jgi:Tol biopolymer transport system component
MSLSAGARLGPYEILSPIGAGGMGEVYRAKDPRLNRDVAVKVLPATYSEDADRLRRFEQEAKAAGALHHPNITAVFDLGQQDGAPYIVQELLEGETLRATLAGGKLSPRRAVDYAIGIARGLAAAHEKGIVHRDLKPENVFVTNDGQVKILDFGLAKLTEVEPTGNQTNLPTATRGTEPGVVMGTLGYMSPEQVRGKPADHRSDIFSFGAILYEMLSGRRAFQGDSAADTMSAILKEDPPELSVTNQSVSPSLDRIVRHCLEKSPERRLHSAHDLAFELEALSQTSGTVAPIPHRSRFRMAPIAIAAAIAAALLGGYFLGRRKTAAPDADAAARSYRRLTQMPGAELSPALSPDGQLLAFVKGTKGKRDVWVQRTGGQNPANLTAGCDRDSYSPAFSPDGNYIAYGSLCGGGGLFLMGATGENARRIAEIGSDPAWSPDGKEIVYNTESIWAPASRATTSPLWIVDVATGKSRKIFDGDAVQASVSPHGLRIAYWGLPDGGSQRDIWTIPYRGLEKGDKPIPVTQDAALDWNPQWSPDGRYLYYLSDRSGAMNLWRVRIDETSGRPLAPPEPRSLPTRNAYGFSMSRDGKRLAYTAFEFAYAIERLVLDPATHRSQGQPVEVLQSSEPLTALSLSDDGATIVFDSQGSTQEDIYVGRADGTGIRKLTDDAPRDRQPSLSPDGKRIVFMSDRSGAWELWTILPDGSGLKPLTRSGKGPSTPIWSPDGKRVAASDAPASYILEVDADGTLTKTTQMPTPPGGLVPNPGAWIDDDRLLVYLAPKEFSGQFDFAIFSPSTGTYTLVPKPDPTAQICVPLPPDGLAFLTGTGLVRTDLHGKDPTLLLSNPKGATYSWAASSRDGRAIYLSRVHENSDIWMATPP